MIANRRGIRQYTTTGGIAHYLSSLVLLPQLNPRTSRATGGVAHYLISLLLLQHLNPHLILQSRENDKCIYSGCFLAFPTSAKINVGGFSFDEFILLPLKNIIHYSTSSSNFNGLRSF